MRIACLLVLLAFAGPSPAAGALPAIQKVVTMLNNLVTMMESESQEDEKKFAHFSSFCENEKASANAKVSEMNTKIEDANAVLVDLRSQKMELDSTVAHLNSNIDTETSQINDATDKRNAEKDAFTKEQIDFDNAISACQKAVELLGAHYGDGTTKEAAKPAWLSLLTTINKAVGVSPRKNELQVRAKGVFMMQQKASQPNNNQYEESTGEGLNIAQQVKLLSDTFAEDKQSAIEEEGRLSKAFSNLIGKKQQILATLVQERDTQQAQLNQVNQNIAEQESALKMAQDTLADRQQYLATIAKQLDEATGMYEQRKKDRSDESKAVNEALGALEKVTGFVQTDIKAHGQALGTFKHRQAPTCDNCGKVAAMLRNEAKVYHSAVLSAAAATTMGSDAIDAVVRNLQDLIKRIDQEQKTEKEHKDWCDEETGLTTAKRKDHSGIVTSLTAVISDLKEVIKEKEIDLDENKDNIVDEDMNFDEMGDLRNDAKTEYNEDVQDHMDAIQALNEAIEILANFYAKRNAAGLVQKSATGFLQQRQAPEGGKTVKIMSGVRKEFEQAKTNLDQEETEAVKTFDEVKAQHIKTDSDLNNDKNTLTVEEQTAENQLDTAQHDKESNEGEVAAADDYLNQLGKSCFPLIMHFDERTKLRREEKAAIRDAIGVLRKA